MSLSLFILADSANPDETQHRGLHQLLRNRFAGI